MENKRDKKELPIYIVAMLIFLSSIAFLVFAVYYIIYLPVPVVVQPLRIRILTTIKKDEMLRESEKEMEEDYFLEEDKEEDSILE